ncbi:MAG: peptide chain release factor I [Rhodospirillales bacterium RIFCSPLOWO2_02_FULL_58_16]|nr:MAG: peptide chain release factor I [Rhodospirillales bacterium RIFCSPLOWO2_02_FULL_58_16]
MIHITPSIIIDDSEICRSFIRASGPGGQNVNKVETVVQLRFDAANSPTLFGAVFQRLKSLAGQRMTRDGVIIITARRFRTQERNRRDAMDRLINLIRRAAVPPKPRRPTKPTIGARERRLDGKRRQSKTKSRRISVKGDED